MGQQQLLLIVLGILVVGIAVAVALIVFKSEQQSSNRDHLVVDLEKLGAVAQHYYNEPSSMNGGAKNFLGFALPASDTGNADGSFALSTQPPNGASFQQGSTAPINAPAQYIYIIGSGKVTGNDNRGAVEAYALVTPESVKIKVMN